MNNILKDFFLLLILMLLVSSIFTFWGAKIFGSVGGYAGSLIGILLVSLCMLNYLFES